LRVAGFLNRLRAEQLMQNEGLSALVLCQPESIVYATGAFPGVASYWRRAGAAFIIVPADAGQPLTAIVGDLQARSFAAQSGISDVRTHRLWVEMSRYPFEPMTTSQDRPGQYDLKTSLALLRDALAERGFELHRVGLELGFVPAQDFLQFQPLPFHWVDCTRIVERLRSIKAPAEIAKLRRAADYASAGLSHLVTAIREGTTAAEMAAIWKQAAMDEAARLGQVPPQSAWSYIAVAGDGFAPGGPANPGDIIKIDVGCVIDGYSSDGARTAVLGEARPDARKIYDALHRAFDKGLSLLSPGRPLREIYDTVAKAMHDQGYEHYRRGHFGHGVGASIWSEEWPFIERDSDAIAEPGMVLAYETPWYIEGLGGFIIEDQLLVTDTGVDAMSPLPRTLITV
jgi:Xaa-Pro aminopeptidase